METQMVVAATFAREIRSQELEGGSSHRLRSDTDIHSWSSLVVRSQREAQPHHMTMTYFSYEYEMAYDIYASRKSMP